jgi:hypothetical protein
MTRYVTPLIFILSLFLMTLLYLPPNDEMLQFIDESAMINVYMIVLTFLVSPVDEIDMIRYEAESEAMKF